MEMALHTTWGFAILGLDVVIFIISNMAAVVWAGQTLVGFWLLFCTFVFQSVAVPGGRILNPMPAQSPVRQTVKKLVNLKKVPGTDAGKFTGCVFSRP